MDATETVDPDILTTAFSVDGTTNNTMRIQLADFNDESAIHDWVDISSVVLLLTEGSQWTGDFAWDFRSRTVSFDVTP